MKIIFVYEDPALETQRFQQKYCWVEKSVGFFKNRQFFQGQPILANCIPLRQAPKAIADTLFYEKIFFQLYLCPKRFFFHLKILQWQSNNSCFWKKAFLQSQPSVANHRLLALRAFMITSSFIHEKNIQNCFYFLKRFFFQY